MASDRTTTTQRWDPRLLLVVDQFAEKTDRSRNGAVEHLVRRGLDLELLREARDPLSTTTEPTDGETK